MTTKRAEIASRFARAAGQGHVSVMELLIQNGAMIDAHGDDGRAAVHHAAAAGQIDVLQFLIEHGTDVNLVDASGATPLHVAAAHGQTQACRQLVERGADIHRFDAEGRLPLHCAVLTPTTDLPAGQESLRSVLSFLSESGLDVDVETRSGRTALDHIVECGFVDNARCILAMGAQVDCTDHDDETPLHRAAHVGDAEMAKVLVAAGAAIDAVDARGCTPLHHHLQARRRNLMLIELLLKNGADPNRPDGDGMTPLERAGRNGDHEAVSRLLKKHGAVQAS